MAPDAAFTFAHNEFYEPLELADPGRRYRPTIPPLGWTSRETGVWTQWAPNAGGLPEQGWKVHVSASLAGAQHVLDVVAAAAELFSRAPAGVGYLLKDRVADVSEFIDAITPGGAGRDGA